MPSHSRCSMNGSASTPNSAKTNGTRCAIRPAMKRDVAREAHVPVIMPQGSPKGRAGFAHQPLLARCEFQLFSAPKTEAEGDEFIDGAVATPHPRRALGI